MLGQGYLIPFGKILIMLNLKREGIRASVPSVSKAFLPWHPSTKIYLLFPVPRLCILIVSKSGSFDQVTEYLWFYLSPGTKDPIIVSWRPVFFVVFGGGGGGFFWFSFLFVCLVFWGGFFF